MPKYIVQYTHIKHAAKDEKEATLYAPGEEIELTLKEAAALGDNVKQVEAKAKGEKGA